MPPFTRGVVVWSRADAGREEPSIDAPASYPSAAGRPGTAGGRPDILSCCAAQFLPGLSVSAVVEVVVVVEL